jgi:hypothetical protein
VRYCNDRLPRRLRHREANQAYRATPGNAPQILELLNRLAGEFDNDAAAKEFLAKNDLAGVADVFFRFRESIKWKEYTTQQPLPSRPSEVIEPKKPRPYVQPQGAYLADFGHHAAREEAGGRFAAVNTFVPKVRSSDIRVCLTTHRMLAIPFRTSRHSATASMRCPAANNRSHQLRR